VRYPTPTEVGAATALATMGALPLGQVPPDETDASPEAYALGSVAGAGVGGGLVGFVAAGDLRGAATGSLLTMGLTSMASAFAFFKRALPGPEGNRTRGLGIGIGLGGLVGVGVAIFMAGQRRGKRSR